MELSTTFTDEERKLLDDVLNEKCIVDDTEESIDEFELNIDTRVYREDDHFEEIFGNDSFDDLLYSEFIHYPTIHDNPGIREFTNCEFSIRDEVEKYDEDLKKRRNKYVKESSKKFNEAFRPLACSTPIPFDHEDKLDEVAKNCDQGTVFKKPHIGFDPDFTAMEDPGLKFLEPTKTVTEVSVDLIKTIDWNTYRAPSVAPSITPSIAPFENNRRMSVVTPYLFPNVLLNEYSVSSSVANENMFFTQGDKAEKFMRNDDIVEKIEMIVESLIEDLCSGNTLSLMIKHCQQSNTEVVNNMLQIKPSDRANFKRVSFHDKNSNRFTLIMLLLSEVYKMLKANRICTKREIYYRNVKMVKNMGNLDNGIRDLCLLLDAASWEFGIISAAKGLVCGPLKIITNSQDVIDCSAIFEGAVLPHNFMSIKHFETNAKFVLVVEKNTVFERLLKDDIFSRMGVPFILVTGKGCPDTGTRVFLKKIWRELKIPIYALVDADPAGIDIMFTYRHGSLAQCQQADSLAVPEIKWIGVHPSDLLNLKLPTLKMTPNDFRKIQLILNRSYVTGRVAQELRILQEGGVKGEIESLYTLSDNYFIDEYLRDKMRNNFAL
ncbi:meiotic recombination protein SPO11 [Sergentomyia squamirostris]